MAHENVQFSHANFCVAPLADEFCSVDYDNDVLRIKTSAGALQQTYSLDTTLSYDVHSLEYVGPRNLVLAYNQLGNSLKFFTLEHVSSTSCSIKKWVLNSINSSLDLETTFNFNGSDYNCYAMSVEQYYTSFKTATTTGTGKIELNNTTHVAAGDELLLGPSTDVDNNHAFEWVEVTSVSGNWVFINTTSGVAPLYEYVDGDSVTILKNIYLFSDAGKAFKINSTTGVVLNTLTSEVYSGVRASAWSSDYDAPGFVKDVNILYLDFSNDQIHKSQVLTNIESDVATVIPIYDLVFDNGTIYRLQKKTMLVSDTGDRTTYTWTTYNYQKDSIAPYNRSLSIYTIPDGVILNQESVTLHVIARDQFGVGLNNINVQFFDSPDSDGVFSPADGKVITDANGQASITYTTEYFDPLNTDSDSEIITISARADGSNSTNTGSVYVWDSLELLLHKRFRYEYNILKQYIDTKSLYVYLKQLADVTTEMKVRSLSKFQFPGGDWLSSGAPSDGATLIKQLSTFSSEEYFTQIANEIDNDITLNQLKEKSDDIQLSQLYVSRHLSSGNADTVEINQFRFIEDAIPAFWSEKNNIGTDIYIRLRPFAFSLNQSTLVFKVRELAADIDTGYVDVTALCNISTFDAGGGLLGLDITYNPPNDFHYNAVIYVSIEVYDVAPTPNIILTDYYFKIIADYSAPYILNEVPPREESDVDINISISFDIVDVGTGVDKDSIELYVNDRYVIPIITSAAEGYHVAYTPNRAFNYGEEVEILVYAKDKASNQNVLYDRWRFYCVGSTGPWVDRESFIPKNCSKGVFRKLSNISFNIYAVDDTGLDKNSILVTIGGKERKVEIIPIIYRIS